MTEDYIRKSIKFKGKNIVYFVRGDSKDAVCYCHGDGQNNTSGRFYLGLFPDTYKKIAIDLPGHGYSQDFEKRTLNIETSVLKAIMNAEKIKSPLIIGHSHGGALSISYAIKYPVKSLILFDPLFADPRKLFDKEPIEILETKYLSMIRVRADQRKKYHVYGNEKTEEEIMRATAVSTPYKTLVRNLSVYEGCDFREDVKKFNFPVLIFQSGNSLIPEVKDISIKQIKSIPKGKIQIVKNGTHNMPLLMKEMLAKIILKNFHFLRV